ncbi:potassium uptake protein, Trk family protein [Clavispora lusitaniae]|uniref:potassium uptake protein, Trk family protein n=1 Tax=Clavispora lusitaniae TaxID=36911 RepID=UPI00202C24E5|nr:potassium uptake protein, Trk family protein [Clavispora lusitaniae]
MGLKSIRKFRKEVVGTTFGHTLRNIIGKISGALHPYVRKVVPNFRTAHYVYIISMVFISSVISYPISNFEYIDILFLMSGACTQAGLNTINLNELKLSQQILVYIITTLTTPIFIHSSLLFLRLYWFERHFDNIKETSKLDHRMRRSATSMARTTSIDPTLVNTVNNSNLGYQEGRFRNEDVAQREKTTSPVHVPTTQPEDVSEVEAIDIERTPTPVDHLESSPQKTSASTPEETNGQSTMYSQPSDPASLAEPIPAHIDENKDKIKFGDLPHPSKRRKEFDPSDMYKSIAMLQNNRSDSAAEDDVLVIKSPKEIERDNNTPIYIKKSSTPKKRRKWGVKNLRKKHTWETIRRNSSSGIRRRFSSNSLNENESIDSEDEDNRRRSGFIDDVLDTDNDAETDHNAENYSVFSETSANDDEDDDEVDQKSDSIGPKDTSHLKFAAAPERHPRPRKTRSRRLSRWRTPTLSRHHTQGTDECSNVDTDDEEPSLSEGEHLRHVMSANYLSWIPTIGRNSTFVHLTEEQKEELGGVEYRAIKLLIKILVVFYIGFHIVAFCLFVGFIKVAKGYAVKMRELGFSPVWWGFFTAQSSFNDLGLTLTPNSMMTYSRSIYILVICSFFVVIGNTGFPIILRFIIWIMFKFARPMSLLKESLGFLLDHPRRCFTLLFPSIPTWWLLFILVVLNATDLILFIVLDFGSEYLSPIPKGLRVLDGLFQAFSTRTAGFSVVDLSQLHPSIQVSYMIMMYISVLPLAISIRRTNVYEEQSLGIYATARDEDATEETPKNFIGSHLRNQLSFDLWYIFLGLFIICIAEGGKLKRNDYRFTVFTILFEIISAYGTVGLSLGYPNIDQSLSHEFTTISKLVIVAMMIRGRHRGLPYSLDRAIMLPDADMQRRDMMQETHAQRTQRVDSISTHSNNDASTIDRLNGLRKTITRKAAAYRKNSLFPAPTKLPEDFYEMNNYPRSSR